MATKKKLIQKNELLLIWLGIAALIVLLDQLSKIFILNLLSTDPSIPISHFFNLALAYNTGAAFSFLANGTGWQRYLLSFIGVIATLVILYLLNRHREQRLFCCALSLILGGAIGNLIDRMMYGYVIDFLDFYIKSWHWPTFNIADSAITIGATLFILDELRRIRT